MSGEHEHPPTKRCTRCGAVKLRTQFWRRTAASDGLQGWCKACMKRRQRNTRETDPIARERHTRYNRTRGRAVAALVARHKAEFDALLDDMLRAEGLR